MKAKTTIYKYPSYIIDAVKEYFAYNENVMLTKSDVMAMDPVLVLDYYLEWEGIIGYTQDILNIITARKEVK